MKHKSHKLLARHLLALDAKRFADPAYRRAFLIGNLLPDYNLFTYLRGFGAKGWMVGHDQISSESRCRRIAVKLRQSGIHTLRSAYVLGALMHYLADSYTFPHTNSFRQTLRIHNAYERELEGVFGDCKQTAERWVLPEPPRDLDSFLRAARERYEASARGPRTDGIYVLWVCSMVYLSIVKENDENSIQNQR